MNRNGNDRFVPIDHRREAAATRRSGEDRRKAENPFEGAEKRASSERRKSFDRRAMGLQVPCKTSGSINSVEDWLEINCDHGWKVVLQKVDEDLTTKRLMVMFETESDRDRFLDRYLHEKQ